MMVNTMRFGAIEVDERQIFEFSKGLPGFHAERRFAFLPHDAGENEKPNFAYLQSLSTPELTFLLADPFAFFPDYEFTVDDATEESLGSSAANLPMVWSIAMIPDKVENMTINLVAPVLFNLENHKATQLILDNNKYSTRHRIFSDDIRERMTDAPKEQKSGEVSQDAGTEPQNK
ncbi:MAG: flagellar assembly protein FliW [Acidaminococcales bacterium]|nr:flagellar assembly protein FliW [Acidaminococcales bacterium]